MGFRLVPKSVTLNDLERRNGRYLEFLPPNSLALGADYVKVVEDRPIQSATSKESIVFLAIYHLR